MREPLWVDWSSARLRPRAAGAELRAVSAAAVVSAMASPARESRKTVACRRGVPESRDEPPRHRPRTARPIAQVAACQAPISCSSWSACGQGGGQEKGREGGEKACWQGGGQRRGEKGREGVRAGRRAEKGRGQDDRTLGRPRLPWAGGRASRWHLAHPIDHSWQRKEVDR